MSKKIHEKSNCKDDACNYTKCDRTGINYIKGHSALNTSWTDLKFAFNRADPTSLVKFTTRTTGPFYCNSNAPCLPHPFKCDRSVYIFLDPTDSHCDGYFSPYKDCNFIDGDLIIVSNGKPIVEDNSDPANTIFVNDILRGTGVDTSACANANSCVKCSACDIFPNLIGVNGSIIIYGTGLSKVTGFHKLSYVAKALIISSNDKLNTIPTFDALENVGGNAIPVKTNTCVNASTNDNETNNSVIINYNPCLRRILGFSALKQICGGLLINDNACLSHICGFVTLYNADSIVIENNNSLTIINGFCYVHTINGDLIIVNNNVKVSQDLEVDAFHYLDNVDNLYFINNYGVQSLNFPELKTVRELVILSNYDLKAVEAEKLLTVTDLKIKHNKSLKHFSFSNLHTVKGSLDVIENGIEKLNGFNQLKRVGGAMRIINNRKLEHIDTFHELIFVGCADEITHSPSNCSDNNDVSKTVAFNLSVKLGSCGLCVNALFTVNPGSDASVVHDCDSFNMSQLFQASVCGESSCGNVNDCAAVTSILLKHSIVIYHNPSLKVIEGFDKVVNVAAGVWVVYNNKLGIMKGFFELPSITDLVIKNNPTLKAVHGFQSLKHARDIAIDAPCLEIFETLENLEHVENIILDVRYNNAVKLRKPLASVNGIVNYYSFEKTAHKKH